MSTPFRFHAQTASMASLTVQRLRSEALYARQDSERTSDGLIWKPTFQVHRDGVDCLLVQDPALHQSYPVASPMEASREMMMRSTLDGVDVVFRTCGAIRWRVGLRTISGHDETAYTSEAKVYDLKAAWMVAQYLPLFTSSEFQVWQVVQTARAVVRENQDCMTTYERFLALTLEGVDVSIPTLSWELELVAPHESGDLCRRIGTFAANTPFGRNEMVELDKEAWIEFQVVETRKRAEYGLACVCWTLFGVGSQGEKTYVKTFTRKRELIAYLLELRVAANAWPKLRSLATLAFRLRDS